MKSASKKLETAFIKKSFQDGVIQGVRLLSTSLIESKVIEELEPVKKMADSIISAFIEKMKNLERSKQPEFVFAENREAYIEHIKCRNWTQDFYIYLYDPDQLRGLDTPIIHYVGNYTNNPKYEAVRKMERARTFKNKE